MVGVALTTFASILWGSTYPAIQIALRYYDAYQISLYRALFGTLALLLYLISSRENRGRLFSLPSGTGTQVLFVAASLFGATGFWTLLNLSVLYLEADTASFLVALYPLISIVLASAFLKDRMTPARAVGVAIGLAGTYVIVSLGERAQVTGSSPLEGSVLALGAALAWACYMITSKVLIDRRDQKTGIPYAPEYVTFTTFAISVLPTLVIVLLTGLPQDLTGSGVGLVDVVYLGVVTSAFAFLIFNVGMKTIGVSRAAVSQLIFPAVAVILSFFLLGQTVNLTEVAGIVMIVIGVIVAQLVGKGAGPDDV